MKHIIIVMHFGSSRIIRTSYIYGTETVGGVKLYHPSNCEHIVDLIDEEGFPITDEEGNQITSEIVIADMFLNEIDAAKKGYNPCVGDRINKNTGEYIPGIKPGYYPGISIGNNHTGESETEQERLEREEQERQEQERMEQERLEQERLEQERLEQERLEQERLEQERLEQERLEQERLEQERWQEILDSIPSYVTPYLEYIPEEYYERLKDVSVDIINEYKSYHWWFTGTNENTAKAIIRYLNGDPDWIYTGWWY